MWEVFIGRNNGLNNGYYDPIKWWGGGFKQDNNNFIFR